MLLLFIDVGGAIKCYKNMHTYYRNNCKCFKTVSKIQIKHYFNVIFKEPKHNENVIK